MSKIDYKALQQAAIRDVVSTARKKKANQTGNGSGIDYGSISRQAINDVSNSIRNKDAVYRTYREATPEDTVRSKLRRIARIGEYDKDAAQRKYDEFMAQRRDKKSKFYDPYTESTHSSVKKLQDLGYDVSNIDDKWFKDNSWYKDYLTLNDYTNSVKKPGKRASREEQAAYEIYQLKKAEENTRKAEKEQEDLRKYLTEAATSKDRTMRDDEIIAGIDWSKYPTLAKMRQYAANGAPMALTRGVAGSSKDWGYGVLWAAMNNGGTGDSDEDIANSAMQAGNTWARQQYNQRKKTKAIQAERDAYSEADMQRAEQMYMRNREQLNRNALAENINNQDVERQKAEQRYQRWAREANDINRYSVSGDMQRAEQQYRRWMNNLTPYQATIDEYKARNNYVPGRGNDIFYGNPAEDLAKQRGELTEQLDGINSMIQYEEEEREKNLNWRPDYSGFDNLFGYIADWDENNERKILDRNSTEDEKKNAQNTLDNLLANREDNRERAINRISGFFATNPEVLTGMWSDDNREELRRVVFNELIGDQEAYDKYYNAFDSEEVFWLDTFIDEALEKVTNPEAYKDENLIEWQNRKNEVERKLSAVERQEAAIAEAERLTAQAKGNGEYRSQEVWERIKPQDGNANGFVNHGDDIDIAVYNANNPWLDELQKQYVSEMDARDVNPDWTEVRPEYFMNDAQVRVLNQLYGDGTPEEKENARAFLEALKTYCLNQLKVQYQEERQRQNAREPLGFLEGVGTIPVNIVAGIMGTGATIASLFGNEAAKDPNSEWYNLQRYVTNTRDERGNVWDEGLVNAFGDSWKGVGKFMNGVAYSMADNITAMATTAGLGKVFNFDKASKTAERLIQLVMSSEATSSTMLEQLKNGNDPWEAAILAIGGGVIEGLTEKYSIERLLQPNVKELLGNGKELLKFIGKNTIVEGAEEVASDVLNVVLDEVLSMIRQHDSQIRTQVKEYKEAHPELTDAQAEQDILKQWLAQTGMDFAAGALSGMIMSSGRVGMNWFSQGNLGKGARSGEAYKANGGDLALVNSAIELPQGSQSRQLAEKVQARLNSGKTVSNRQVGQLVQNIYNETDENISQAKKSGEITDETVKSLQVRDSVSELIGAKKSAEADTGDVKTTQMADENEIAEAEQAAIDGRGKKTGTSRDVIVNGEYGQITGITNTDGKTFLTVDVNGTTQRIDVNDASTIRATDFGTAAIIRQATVVNKGLYQASANQTDNNFRQYTDILLDAQANGKAGNIGTFLANAERVRIAAFTGQAMPIVNMDRETALEIYKNSALEHKANRLSDEQTGGANFKGAGNGGALFNGAAYGTDAWSQALDDAKVDEITRNRMNTTAEIARRSGIEVTFLTNEQARERWNLADGEDAELYYGSEGKSGIAINIEGQNADLFTGKKTGQHHMMVTFGHEMTHWLQRNSLKGYTNLERFVASELVRTKGENHLNKRLGQIMEAQGLNLEDAMSELVAESCDQILASEEVQKHIAETNQSLFTEIKGFVKELVTRIKNAVKSMSESQSQDAMAMMRSANRLAKVWLGAYDEAISGKIAEAEAETGETVRNSRSVLIINENMTQNDLISYYHNQMMNTTKYLKRYEMNEELDAKQIIKELKEIMPESLNQWLHNAIVKKNATVKRKQIERFLHQDYDELRKNSQAIVNGWKGLLKGKDIKPLNINNTEANGGTLRTKTTEISKKIFGEGKNKRNIWVEDTNTTVRMDSNTIDKSILYNDEHDIQWRTVEKVLRNAPELLENAKYIGSHRNYAYTTGEVHYYASAVTVNETNKKTSKESNVLRAVVFAVHDAVNQDQRKQYNKRAYVAEIMVTEKEDNQSPLNASDHQMRSGDAQALRLAMPSKNIIGKVLNSVNADRVRSFNKENLNEQTVRFSKATVDPKQQELSQAWQDARDEANELREQLRNMKPEVDAWVERISEAQKDGNMDAVMAEYKEWEKGYTKVKNDLDKAEQRYKEANKAYDDYIEQRDVAEEQKKIEASGLSEPEYRRKQAVDVFGYTTDFREAGYMLPNGRMLNFSGEKGKHYGSRGEDHRGIGQIYASSEYQGGAAMMAFMRDGNIRVMAETPGVDIVASQEPTAEQYAAIRNMARRFAGEEYFNVDFTDDRGYNVDSIEYDGRVNPERVVNDIKTFYKTGSAPKQSTVSQFHYSRATSLGLDVGRWMSEQTPGSLLTESERELLSKYKGLRVSIDLSLKKQEDYKRDIRRMQANESQLTAHEREDLETLRLKLKNEEQKYTDLQYKLYQVTSADGYAGMMYQSNMILNDFVLGKTQKQVSESVDNMVKEMQKARTEIEKQSADLKKLAETQAVQTMKSYLQSTSLSFAAKSLKKELNSKMNAAEVENRLAEMALKKANGESIVEDARALAYDMTNQMRGYQLDVMERMRGVTITIGPDQQAEMKGNGMTLASVREALKGTGIRVKYGTFSSLDTDTQEGGDLRTLLPELPAEISENSADALNKFISWAQSQRDADLEAKQSMVDLDDATINVIALASTVTTEMTNDPAAKKQIDKLMKQVKDLSGRTEAIAGRMDSIIDQMDNVEMAGLQAKGSASVLQRDVHTAIDYFNKIAKIAAQEERMRVKKDVIEKLRSENTRNLIKQQMKYEEMMKNDRKARGLAEDNKVLRNRITTVAKRAANRLFNETDQKNIPEEAKPLARKLLELLTNHDYTGYRHVLFLERKQLEQAVRSLDSYRNRDGDFNPDTDLNWLIVGSGKDADTEMADRAYDALMLIESGLLEYRQAEGQKHITLMDRKAALQKIQTAVSEIWSMIDARANAEINHRKMLVEEIALQAQDDMQHSRFKGENTGVIGHGKKAVKAAVFYGNMTPEYFFKMLRNNTISQLYEEYHRAENKYGLLADKTTRKIAEIADRYGFGTWDQKKTYTFQLEKGGEVELTLGEIMSLCATWQREAMNQAELNGPEKSFHLEIGGFVTEAKEKHKINGREFFNQRPHSVTQNDINAMLSQMTDDQKNYMYDLVTYITKEIGKLGNEASMRMYGIKKFKEKFYFPMKVWNGVLARKSDAGTQQKTDNRTAHNSASKRRTANANNALLIRDFTKVVCEHTEMQLRYNTFAPAIEFMNRTMNQQLKVETGDPEGYTKRTLEAAFQEAYGEEAGKYYRRFMEDINGGVNRSDANIYDKLLSTFKKSAVAGSMSVAFQQPLSFIRAGMMINPKYLVTSVNFNPAAIKKTAEEMWKYSGVAVIKKIGKFDMNYGRSTIDYMTPEAKKGKFKAGYEWLSDKTTALPELMDTWTWCNMWNSVKKEQAALNPGMDTKSDEFLEKVAERFNDVMRKTQVYDSVLVKSQNMRSTDKITKAFTSFMSEPTLTLNVLADAFGEMKAGDKGGKAKFAKAATTFILSAVMQALVKGLISAGRNPQERKTWDENVAYRFTSSLISEINPVSLIPGYSDLMTLFKDGEVNDDALGVIGNMIEAVKTGKNWITGDSENPWYRDLEDSIGVITQLISNIPLKNLVRDVRAISNYIVAPWADRENSMAVLKYQALDLLHNANNMTGVINAWAGDKGWETKNEAYFKRIYEADKAGNKDKVAGLMEYLTKARGTKESKINEAIRGLTKEDKKLTNEEKIAKLREQGMKDSDIAKWITDQYSKKQLTKEEATKLYQLANPKANANDAYFAMERKDDGVTGTSSDYFRLDEAIEKNDSAAIRQAESELLKHGYTKEQIEEHKNNLWWKKDREDYKKATGKEVTDTHYRLADAISANRSEQIQKAVRQMIDHGSSENGIQSWISKEYKAKYLRATGDKKRRLKDALTKALKATGMTEEKAIKRIDSWKESKKK